MNSTHKLLLALAFASAAPLAAAADDFPGRDPRATPEANSVDGTGTFSVNPRFPGGRGETGPDPSDMAVDTPQASDWKPVAQPTTDRYAWSVDEVYLPTPQPQSGDAFPERAPNDR